MTPASSRITDLSQLPLVLTIDEMAVLYRRAKSTIRRNIQLQRFEPRPFDGPPYRWLKTQVESDLRRRIKAPPKRTSSRRRARPR